MFTEFGNVKEATRAWQELWLTARSLLTEYSATGTTEFFDEYISVRAEMFIFAANWEHYGEGLV